MVCVGLNQQIPTKLLDKMFAHSSKLGNTESCPLLNFGVTNILPSTTSRSKDDFD